ncbi:MAG TPA: hypothetical protein VJ862_03890 [Rhodanobacteraceae bacterium]|nr:hypothetical protein [Rhodanobacteraceae bacterium]
MFRKLIAIVLAVLINCAVLAWFHAWSANAIVNAEPASTGVVLTLPTINVRPTRAQLDALRRERVSPVTSSLVPADAGMRMLVMPFYSFAEADATASA